jgi:hypothetical protein
LETPAFGEEEIGKKGIGGKRKCRQSREMKELLPTLVARKEQGSIRQIIFFIH